MNEYNKKSACQKCGEKRAASIYHKESEIIENTTYYKCICEIFIEHIRRECINCGYVWGERVKVIEIT